jgi:hypothetical protein
MKTVENSMGICPTGKHLTDYRQYGFTGSVDLRPWARANRYRFRLEESFKAESNTHVRGDGRWYVEILCQRGLIYPKGGNEILAFATSTDAWQSLLELGCKPHQVGDKERVCRFPVELLDEVAAILRPRRRRVIMLAPEQIEARRETLRLAREARKSLSPERENGSISNHSTRMKGAVDVTP